MCLLVQDLLAKIFCLRNSENRYHLPSSRLDSLGGAFRGRHDTWGGDAVDVEALSDEQR